VTCFAECETVPITFARQLTRELVRSREPEQTAGPFAAGLDAGIGQATKGARWMPWR